MIEDTPYTKTRSTWQLVAQKMADYRQLGKLRLSLVVVQSAAIAFLLGSDVPPHWAHFAWLVLGGLLITLSANALNETLEVAYDAEMRRTAGRPLPGSRMTRLEAIAFASLTGLGGVLMLWQSVGLYSALLGLGSLLLYAFVYTPAKRMGAIAVWVGAVPGALPALIGWVAATGSFSAMGWLLFALQFFWQLPHFWSIAWLAHEDYTRAGFRLLPAKAPGKWVALQVILWTLPLIPLSLLPHLMGLANTTTTVWLFLFAVAYLAQTVQLWVQCTRRAALLLMFGSFLYLPAVQVVFLLEKYL
ncbi:MAG: heme o synthase [Bacteroidetes bacterium]|nr:heme o synthase [Bacteroidota bacterium]